MLTGSGSGDGVVVERPTQVPINHSSIATLSRSRAIAPRMTRTMTGLVVLGYSLQQYFVR
jgi:hypothetical protein